MGDTGTSYSIVLLPHGMVQGWLLGGYNGRLWVFF